MASIQHRIRRSQWSAGVAFSRLEPATNPVARQRQLFETYGIRSALDGGANAGQYGLFLSEDINFRGRIVSFEPLSGPYSILSRHASADPDWTVMNFALGAAESTAEINVSSNAYGSSILNILPAHTRAEPESTVIARETIQIKTLDSVVAEHCPVQEGAYLTIDTQGYEHPVLQGAERSLAWIQTLQLELSLTPLYQDQKLVGEMLEFWTVRGIGWSPLIPHSPTRNPVNCFSSTASSTGVDLVPQPSLAEPCSRPSA